MTTTFTNSGVSTEDIDLHNNSRNVSKDWTFQDIQHLLKTAKQFLPENDILNYRNSISLLDWNRIKFSLFTANDCRDKLLEVTEMLRRHRTLSELLVDAGKFFDVSLVNVTTPRVVSAGNLQLTENIETLTATSNEMELNMTVKDTKDEISADETDLDDLFEEIQVPVQDISTQTDVNSVEHDVVGQGKFNLELETVLTQTNWSRVVVNCGEKVDAHVEKIEKTTRSKRLSIRNSALNNETQMSDATNQKSVKIVDSNKKSVKSAPKKKLAKIAPKKKSLNKVAAMTNLKPPTFPFIHFFLEVKDKLKEKHPEMNMTQLASLAGEEYRKLPVAKKKIYRMKYYEEKKHYLQAMNNAQVTGKPKRETTHRACKKKMKINSADKNKNRDQIKRKPINKKDSEVRSGNNSKTIALIQKEPCEKSRKYWGFLVYAKENLDKLIYTKAEEKMNVIYNSWRSLDDDDKEVYIKKGLRLPYVDREKLEQIVQRKGNAVTM